MAQVVFYKKANFMYVPINFALQPIDIREKYSVEDPYPYS